MATKLEGMEDDIHQMVENLFEQVGGNKLLDMRPRLIENAADIAELKASVNALTARLEEGDRLTLLEQRVTELENRLQDLFDHVYHGGNE